MDLLKMYLLWNMVAFNCHASSPEGILLEKASQITIWNSCEFLGTQKKDALRNIQFLGGFNGLFF